MSKNRETKVIRIGGASGYWGDSQDAPRQLVMHGDVDYLVFDYLAEVTMSILVRAKEKSPDLGYARDFVDLVMKPLIHDIKSKGIRVVVNAGGVNVPACAAALQKVADEAGVSLKIGTVEGDNLLDQLDELQENGINEMFSGAPLPEKVISANAYLGAFPIAAALNAGADVVITGRCVDSAVTLGPLIHEFGWREDDFDKLASGTLAGHIIECGAQATGGNFTDWRDTVDGWDNMGYPIAVCRNDGNFAITKPADTGGIVSRLSVGEQILYEIGDPAAYIMPDVVCDFTEVQLKETQADWLEVSGVKGLPPTPTYKVSATYRDGYRATASTIITGFEAVEKGQAYSDALIKRTRRLFAERNFGDYRGVATHIVGADTLWGDNATSQALATREVTARIDVRHDEKAALELFSKETTGVGLSMTTGRCSAGAAGRPKVTPVVAMFSFLVDKEKVSAKVCINGAEISYNSPTVKIDSKKNLTALVPESVVPVQIENAISIPLIKLAVARSGDKGNNANIGVMARKSEYLDYIRASITEDSVANWFSHTLQGDVTRFEVPGMQALNFLMTDCLDGGATSSLHLDNMGKTYAQQILAMPVLIPEGLI
ncbi:terpene utilization protein AtuA [Alphaproteobacteria bacterium 46_93_T64]|nr:terpene utilization protein AtuA [Alphaproteobacteria bacterium 46_93_T64]